VTSQPPVTPDDRPPTQFGVPSTGADRALDELAHRDYVIGLEAEVAEARLEIARLGALVYAMKNRWTARTIHSVEHTARTIKRRLR